MALYEVHPHAPTRLVQLIREYRHWDKLLTAFIKPYQTLAVDGVLHCTYNQMVRTGRMSCSLPNMQQLSKDAKRLIQEGGAKVNDAALTDAGQMFDAASLSSPLKLSAGKKRHALIKLG